MMFSRRLALDAFRLAHDRRGRPTGPCRHSRCRRRSAFSVTPRARKAPKLWPAVPVSAIWIVSSGRPAWPNLRATSPDSIAPTVRFTFLIVSVICTGLGDFAERGLGRLDQLVIERAFQAVVLRLGDLDRHAWLRRRLIEDLRQIDALGLPVIDGLLHVEQVNAPDHLLDLAEAQLAP